jgi:hypothetical protein
MAKTKADERRAPTRRQREPGIRSATRAYEAWLRKQTPLNGRDLRYKHKAMGKSTFAFLRATYYRWAQVWPVECPELAKAPVVMCVGDLHIENFGTWRDAEGRLAWGVNDFDESTPLPYTNDLVRLATSAFLAIREERLDLIQKAVCALLLEGYEAGLRSGGSPVVLAERHRKLGERVLECLIEPKRFWGEKLGKDLRLRPGPSPAARAVLESALPAGARGVAIRSRIAGLGSLGRPRFVAIADWKGGMVAREAKAFAPSAAAWATGATLPDPPNAHVLQLLEGAIRSKDPFLVVSTEWIVRRLAPDSDKVRLASLGSLDLEAHLLVLMGREVANVHLATPGAAAVILRHLRGQAPRWLRGAAAAMTRRVERDHQAWLPASTRRRAIVG